MSDPSRGLQDHDRSTIGCPSWCVECQPDGVSPAVNHWSAGTVLPGCDLDDLDLEPATLEAHTRQEQPGEPLPAPVFVITSRVEYVRSADWTRAFAQAILSYVDSITDASSRTSR